MGDRLLANKPFTNGKRNRANTVSRQKDQGACLQTQKSHFSLLVRAHKGMNIHCPIFSAVCFTYLFKWFLLLCLSLTLSYGFLCFFPYVQLHKSAVEVQKQQMCFLPQSLGFGARNKEERRTVFGFGARSYYPQSSSQTQWEMWLYFHSYN